MRDELAVRAALGGNRWDLIRQMLTETLLLAGMGALIGLGLAQALKHVGCAPVIVVDVVDDRLALAEKCGATHTINSARKNALNSILNLTQGRGADVACEAVGVTATVELALRCARKGGSVALVGNVAPSIAFPLQTAVTCELNIFGSCASRGEISSRGSSNVFAQPAWRVISSMRSWDEASRSDPTSCQPVSSPTSSSRAR